LIYAPGITSIQSWLLAFDSQCWK